MTPHNPQEETKKLVFESREEAKRYWLKLPTTGIRFRDMANAFIQWLSEEGVIIKEELKDK